MSQRYVSEKFLPDKAIDLLDEAGAETHMFNFKVPKKILKIEEQLKKLKAAKEEEESYSTAFEEAAVIRDKEKN